MLSLGDLFVAGLLAHTVSAVLFEERFVVKIGLGFMVASACLVASA